MIEQPTKYKTIGRCPVLRILVMLQIRVDSVLGKYYTVMNDLGQELAFSPIRWSQLGASFYKRQEAMNLWNDYLSSVRINWRKEGF